MDLNDDHADTATTNIWGHYHDRVDPIRRGSSPSQLQLLRLLQYPRDRSSDPALSVSTDRAETVVERGSCPAHEKPRRF